MKKVALVFYIALILLSAALAIFYATTGGIPPSVTGLGLAIVYGPLIVNSVIGIYGLVVGKTPRQLRTSVHLLLWLAIVATGLMFGFALALAQGFSRGFSF